MDPTRDSLEKGQYKGVVCKNDGSVSPPKKNLQIKNPLEKKKDIEKQTKKISKNNVKYLSRWTLAELKQYLREHDPLFILSVIGDRRIKQRSYILRSCKMRDKKKQACSVAKIKLDSTKRAE